MRAGQQLTWRTGALMGLACGLAALTAGPATAQEPEQLTEPDVIAGTMEITFKTRSELDTSGKYVDGSPRLGVQDLYELALRVAKTTEFSGKIVRQPNIFTKTLRRLEQGAALGYDITLSVLNPRDPKQKKAIGKWVGVIPIDTATGAYDLAGGKKSDDRPLRIQVEAAGSVSGFTDYFAGRMMGKAEKKENLAEYHYKRLVGKREVVVTVKKSDPMRFDNLVLAKGPSENYPQAVANGRLDYDYETGNWYTDGVRFKYSLNGKEYDDVMTGSIRWVEDPDRAINGKGYYEFNLRFNEEKNRTAGTESDAFANISDEEAFFAVDDTIPALTGRINYVDTMGGEDQAPLSSKITYNLNANKLTKQQIMNFFKLWLVCIGPTNDE